MTLTQIKPAGLSKPIDLGDNEKIRLGTNNDLELYHSGSHSYITNVGEGNLYIKDPGIVKIISDSFKVDNADESKQVLKCVPNAGIELYCNGIKYFELISAGINFIGSNSDQLQWQKANNLLKFRDGTKAVFGEGDDLQIYGGEGGTGAVINSANGDLFFRHGSDEQLTLRDDGAVELYYDNVRKLRTTNGGITIEATDAGGSEHFGRLYFKQESGTVRGLFDPASQKFQIYDNSQFSVGNSHDSVWFHDGSNTTLINNTGNLLIKNDGTSTTEEIIIQAKGGEDSITAKADGAVTLFHNNIEKLQTQAGGVSLISPGDDWNEIKRTANGYYGFSWIKEDGSSAQAYLGVTGAAASINNSAAAQDLVLRTQTNFILTRDYTTKLLSTDSNGAVSLYYGNSKKLETANGGINITNSGAIYLGGTGSANALYDYEKGTFTPRFHGNGNNNTITTSTNLGEYVKIGRLVYVKIRSIFTDRNGANSTFAMDGLPFSNAGNHTTCNVGRWANTQNHSVIGQFTGYIGDGSQEIVFNSFTSTGISGSDVNQVTDTTTVMLSFTYPAWGQ